jgi:hypothetical protein
MDTLNNILGKKIAEQAGKAAAATNGDSGDGPRNWPTLPLDREFRAKVMEASLGTLASGAPVLNLTLSVVDPSGEFDGRRIWDSWFYTGVEFQLEKIAQLLYALEIGPDELPVSDDYAVLFSAVAPIMIDRTLFVALRNQVGKDGVARSRVRYTNVDRGREPRQTIKPPVDKTGSSPNLSVDVSSLLVNEGPFPERTDQASAPAPRAVVPQASGIRLPTATQ